MNRKLAHLALCLLLLYNSTGCSARTAPAQVPPAPITTILSTAAPGSIEDQLKHSFLELVDMAHTLRYTPQQYEQVRKRLEQEEDRRKNQLKDTLKYIEAEIAKSEQQLKDLNAKSSFDTAEITSQRDAIHCTIQKLRTRQADTRIALQSGIPIEYENLYAKLELMQKWPAAEREIAMQVERGQARQRKWGDVQDIGYRTIEKNQEDDIKDGQQAIDEMKRSGLLPKEIEDKQINEYVNRVAQNLARNSDLRVPLQVTLLNSKEINAFALPGGFLFINHGLTRRRSLPA
jgi:chromosome segregation ATPase